MTQEEQGVQVPQISTVIISRPQELGLRRALVSALNQQGPAFEVIVVLDGACAQNRRAVAAVRDARVRVFEHETTRGRGAARARAIAEARAPWIANVDADDWIFGDKQQQQWEFLQQNPAVDLVSTGLSVVDNTGALRGVRTSRLRGRGRSDLALASLPTPSWMIRRDLVRAVGFDPRYVAGEDKDFLYRALPQCTWAMLPTAAYVYNEYASHSWRRCVGGYARRVGLDLRHGRWRDGVHSAAKNGVKAALASAAFAVGQGDLLVERRSQAPTRAQEERYARERAALEAALRGGA